MSYTSLTGKRNRRQIFLSVAICTIFALGLWLGWTGNQHGLPYIDEPDEMTIWTMGRAYFDPNWIMFQPHYPPGILIVSSLVQRLEIFGGNPYYDEAGTTATMRALSGAAYAITLLLIMGMAYRLSESEWRLLTAALAGMAWITIPLVIGRAKLAVIDPWLWLWMTASVAAGVESWLRRSAPWLALSIVLGMVAAVFKWQGAAALAVPGLACLRWWSIDRRRTIVYSAIYMAAVGAFAYWAIFIYQALEGDAYLPGTHTIRPTLAIVARNIQFQLTETGAPIVFGVLPLLALILPLWATTRYRAGGTGLWWQVYGSYPLWMFAVVIAAYDVILSFNGAPVFARQYLAANALLAVMAGCGSAQLAKLIGNQIVRTNDRSTRWKPVRRMAFGLVALALAIGVITPWSSAFSESYSANLDALRPDRRNALAQWASGTAIDGALIVTEANLSAALQTLYGYRGRSLQFPFNQGTTVHPAASNITSAMLKSGQIRYIITQPNFIDEPQTDRFGAQITHLITYDANHNNDPPMRGDEWAAYYVGHLPPLLPPDQVVTFDHQIALRGLQFSVLEVCPSGQISLRTLWSAPQSPRRNYSFYVHLYSAATGERNANLNGNALADATRPTSSWAHADELLIGDPLTLTLSPDLPPGTYQLWLGVFEPIGNQRLHLPDGVDHYTAARLTIAACPATSYF